MVGAGRGGKRGRRMFVMRGQTAYDPLVRTRHSPVHSCRTVRILLLNRPPVNGITLSGCVYLGDEHACTRCKSLHSPSHRMPLWGRGLHGRVARGKTISRLRDAKNCIRLALGFPPAIFGKPAWTATGCVGGDVFICPAEQSSASFPPDANHQSSYARPGR